MPCYHPLTGYRSRKLNPSGKRSIVFNLRDGYRDLEVTLPCGQCIGCRLERSRQWAIRCEHESSLYEKNCFITLTYTNENLPKFRSLERKAPQDFIKRLRIWHQREFERRGLPWDKDRDGIRFYGCGEYGDKFERPHYHLCLFNFNFEDRYAWKVQRGFTYYRSAVLESLWPYGHSAVADFSWETAAYCARYVTKKQTGKKVGLHYDIIDYDSGEIIGERTPEFAMMSRRPGIARHWFDQNFSNIYSIDKCVMRGGRVFRPPKYYDSRFELIYPDEMARIKGKRRKLAISVADDNTPDRLAVKEEVQRLKLKQLKRSYENEA